MVLATLLAGCTEAVPEYCDDNKPCPQGQFCNLGRNACEPKQDGSMDWGVSDKGLDLTTVPSDGLLDTMPIDTVKPDIWGPPKCGDKVKNGTEKCDNKDFGGATCSSLGFDGGGLTCSSDCKTINTTGCFKCGDKVKNGAEECDTLDFGTTSCQSKGFECGDLTCSGQCKISTSGCKNGWATKIPAAVEAMAVDSSGNVTIAGTFTSSVTFSTTSGTTSLSSSSANLYIARLNNKGQILWAKGPSGFVNDVRDVAVDNTGNTYISGNFQSTVTFGLTTFIFQGSCGDESYVVKLDSTGQFKWAKYIGGPNSHCENANALAVDSSSLYVTGTFQSEADFGTITKKGVGTVGTWADVFVAKMNPADGSFIWVAVGGGDAADYAHDIAVDTAGNTYITGNYGDVADFGPSTMPTPSSSVGNVFAAKLNTSGTFVWATPLGGDTLGGANNPAIAVDSSGTSYVTGGFKGTRDFGGSQITSKSSSYDAFVVDLSGNGQVGNVAVAGGSGLDSGAGIVAKKSNGAFIIGRFDTAASVGLQTISGGQNNPFLWNRNTVFDTAMAGVWDAVQKSGSAHDPGVIDVDGDGLLHVGGVFTGSKQFGSTTLSGGGGFVWNAVCHFP
jgi:hypothetical protein